MNHEPKLRSNPELQSVGLPDLELGLEESKPGMYIPTQHLITEKSQLVPFMRQYSFATLISCGRAINAAPEATHLPLLTQELSDGTIRLTGHFARANEHWKLCASQKVLAIFHGPHSHISASWYGEASVVPTWNYLTVHATGRLTIVDDPRDVRAILEATVDTYEQKLERPWAMSDAPADYIEKLQAAIVAVQIDVDELQGKWKLNQHHPAARREATIRELRRRGTPDDLAIANLMEETLQN